MKKVLFLSICLLMTPFMAYAGAVQYGLIQNGGLNGFNVTDGNISYYFSPVNGSLPDHCPLQSTPKTVPLNTVVNLPLLVWGNQTSRFTFQVDPALQDCFTNGAEFVSLNITQVDAGSGPINKKDGVCETTDELDNYNDYVYSNLSIQVNTDSFYCNKVMAHK